MSVSMYVRMNVRIYIYIYIYCTLLLVPSNPLCSYPGNLKNVCVCITYCRIVALCMYVCMHICMFVCVYVCFTLSLLSSDPLRNDITCHLASVRGTPTLHCDRTDRPKVYIRFLYSLIRESINACVIRR